MLYEGFSRKFSLYKLSPDRTKNTASNSSSIVACEFFVADISSSCRCLTTDPSISELFRLFTRHVTIHRLARIFSWPPDKVRWLHHIKFFLLSFIFPLSYFYSFLFLNCFLSVYQLCFSISFIFLSSFSFRFVLYLPFIFSFLPPFIRVLASPSETADPTSVCVNPLTSPRTRIPLWKRACM